MINVVKYRFVTALTSVILICASVGFAMYKKQTTGAIFNYSVDFTGGAQVLLRFEQPADIQKIKTVLDSESWQGATVREFDEHEIMVRIKLDQVGKELGVIAEKMKSSLQAAMPDQTITILQSESVGPDVGESLRGKSMLAIVYASLAMLVYIWFRFWSFGYAIGAVIALIHDAFLMLAVFLFTGREISVNVIGAILTVIGYSVNDTIVIFSQIRDNMKRLSHESLANIVNVSINQTLRRTMLTSFSTGIAVLSMLVLGGEVLRDFMIALLVGVIVGTYSSIYIASPIMMMFARGKRA